MKKITTWTLFLTMLLLLKPVVFSHCEVPCGIYNDQMRFTQLEEHITTIEKAIKQITALSKESPQNMNQIVRWVMNKEKHAEEIQHIISQYFMTQRLKLADKNDAEGFEMLKVKLVLCHEIIVYAMKAKQSTDLDIVKKLKTALVYFKTAYLKNQKP
ncbi:superoxide dismutase [Ni] [Acidobacteriota bacterium]